MFERGLKADTGMNIESVPAIRNVNLKTFHKLVIK